MPFQIIKGQDRPIRLLKECLKSSRLEGSYLFVGEEGIGKKLVAKTLAKALNCESQALDSCDTCVSCLKIEKGQHPDIHIIDGIGLYGINHGYGQKIVTEETDAIKIEYIRQLQKDINLKPYEGKRKVFIIDNAHNLTPDAANALLKILEEPPANSLIVLVSAKPALLFKTIISRCKIIKFYPLQRSMLEGILKTDFHLDNNLAHYLAYFCEGRIGHALRLKDADILKEKNAVIDAFTPLETMGRQKKDTVSLTGFAPLARQGSGKPLAENRNNVRGYLNILAAWFRDMYLIKIGTPYSELINFDRREELLKLMHRYTFVDLYEIFNSLSGSLLYLERNINVKLLLSNLKWSVKTEG